MPTALTHADTSDTYEEGLSRVVLVHLACSQICRYSQTNSHYSRCGFQGRIIKVDGRDARQGEESEGAPRVCPSFNALYDTLMVVGKYCESNANGLPIYRLYRMEIASHLPPLKREVAEKECLRLSIAKLETSTVCFARHYVTDVHLIIVSAHERQMEFIRRHTASQRSCISRNQIGNARDPQSVRAFISRQ